MVPKLGQCRVEVYICKEPSHPGFILQLFHLLAVGQSPLGTIMVPNSLDKVTNS